MTKFKGSSEQEKGDWIVSRGFEQVTFHSFISLPDLWHKIASRIRTMAVLIHSFIYSFKTHSEWCLGCAMVHHGVLVTRLRRTNRAEKGTERGRI